MLRNSIVFFGGIFIASYICWIQFIAIDVMVSDFISLKKTFAIVGGCNILQIAIGMLVYAIITKE